MRFKSMSNTTRIRTQGILNVAEPNTATYTLQEIAGIGVEI
ncbi:hypothetical protein OK016_26880 [Vibrio chagasii]|nr:hypothetical protein [Vibrio chagasii]